MKNKKTKKKKCKHCHELFTPLKHLQYICTPLCFSLYSAAKKKKKNKLKSINKKYSTKPKVKSKSNLESLFQVQVNKLVRLIDSGQNCISCNNKGEMHAGHYHTTNGNPSIRFNLFNIYLQCSFCNINLSGNIKGYDKGLIQDFGKVHQEFVKLDLKRISLINLSRFEIIDKTKLVRMLIKEFEVRKLNSIQRLDLRYFYQKIIGIYH